jgi:RNase adaptor protein for sRNA GlmZ degradation
VINIQVIEPNISSNDVLKTNIGTNKDVRKNITTDKRNLKHIASIWQKLDSLHDQEEMIDVAIGCERGKHRSVTIGIIASERYNTQCIHRDLEIVFDNKHR